MYGSKPRIALLVAAACVACLPLCFAGLPARRGSPRTKLRLTIEATPPEVTPATVAPEVTPATVAPAGTAAAAVDHRKTGRIPHVNLSGEPTRPRPMPDPIARYAEQFRYDGIRITPQLYKNEKDFAVQKQFAIDLRRLDLVPKHRKDHFAWCVEAGATITDWRGSVREFSESGGVYKIKVSISPEMTFGEFETWSTGDHIFETYLYSKPGIRYLSGHEPDVPVERVMTHW